MTDRDLVDLFPAIRFLLSRPELLMRSLRLGPELPPVIEDLMRAARVLTPMLAAWSVPSLGDLGFEEEELPLLFPPMLN